MLWEYFMQTNSELRCRNLEKNAKVFRIPCRCARTHNGQVQTVKFTTLNYSKLQCTCKIAIL